MNFLIYFLLTIAAFVITIFVIFFIVKVKLKSTLGTDNFHELADVMKHTQDLELEEFTRVKDVGGLTKLLEPIIIRDFPGFQKELLYTKVENGLGQIFRAITEKNMTQVNKAEELALLQEKIKREIDDEKERNISIQYNDVQFHEHAIKAYDKKDGVATITTSSSVEYYYTNSGAKKNRSDVKKQTRYTCQFVYVFDESKMKEHAMALTIHCPNCGAPIQGLGNVNCSYCGSFVEPVNLKAWKMSSFTEDYKEKM